MALLLSPSTAGHAFEQLFPKRVRSVPSDWTDPNFWRQRALKELTNAKGVVSLEAEQAALEKLSSRADNTPIVSPQATEEAPAETETI